MGWTNRSLGWLVHSHAATTSGTGYTANYYVGSLEESVSNDSAADPLFRQFARAPQFAIERDGSCQCH